MCLISPISCWHVTHLSRHSVRLMNDEWHIRFLKVMLFSVTKMKTLRTQTVPSQFTQRKKITLACYACLCFHLSFSANALYDFYSGIVDHFIFIPQWSWLFLSVKGRCVDKQNNTWLLVDMKFLFYLYYSKFKNSTNDRSAYSISWKIDEI